MSTPTNTIERHCFKKEVHESHVWHDRFYCKGQGLDEDGRVRTLGDESPAEAEAVETTPAPGILDGRAAYGDRVTNMREQAAMFNAYLGTPPRAIEPHDVPILYVLTKIHRLGKMPDYADNYNDIDGYMQIAREVIGDDMIGATTAKEYAEIKRRGKQGSKTSAIAALLQEHGVNVTEVVIEGKPRHPYENVERDAERDAMNSYTIMGSDGRDHSA
ncbi:hypothetical protein SEA_YELLOWPANDA_6 [Microbacterium phage YellowPanda]